MKNINLKDARSTNPKKDENKKSTPRHIIIKLLRDRDNRKRRGICHTQDTDSTSRGGRPSQNYGGERQRNGQLRSLKEEMSTEKSTSHETILQK